METLRAGDFGIHLSVAIQLPPVWQHTCFVVARVNRSIQTVMRKRIISSLLSVGLFFGAAAPSFAAKHHRTRRHSVKHKRRVDTAKRVGIGAGGGAAVGALAGGGKGAAIGGIAGAGAGVLYDRHKKAQGK